MPTETPVRPAPKQLHPLPSIKVIQSASASIGLLIETLSLLLEPSSSLKSDLAPELQTKLHSDHPPPVKYYRDLLDLAATVVNDWPNAKKADFLSGHPRIGEVHGLSKFSANEQGTGTATPTPSHVLKRLAALNAAYEKRFPGLRFVTFVNGRSREQIGDELDGVLKQHPDPVVPGSAQWTAELDRGIRDVWLIAKARLTALKVK